MIRRPDLHPFASMVLSALAGSFIGFGQAPISWWPLTIIGVGMLTWLLQGRTKKAAAGLGYLAGIICYAVTILWISVLGVGPAIGLISFSACWYALAGLLISRLVALPGRTIWVSLLWVAVEFVSGKWPFGGFSWVRFAYATLDQPLSGYLPYLGASGATFIFVWIGQALFSKRVILLGPVAVSLLIIGLVLPGQTLPVTGENVVVANVQPNVNRHEYGGPNYARAVTNNALSSTVFALAKARTTGEKLSLVLWPESASDYDPLQDEKARHQVDLATRLAQVPVLVGAVTIPENVADARQTTGIFWEPGSGPGDRYHKRNLVPFGEWIPFREVLLPRFPILRQIGRQSIPGTTAGVLSARLNDGSTLKVGDLICFELAYDETVYDVAVGQPQIVVSQSNENTYAGTFQVPQQLAMNRIRALEMGREIVASTLNSTSGTIEADGSVSDLTAEFKGAASIVSVPVRSGVTTAVVIAPWISRLSLCSVVALTLWGAVQSRLRQGRLEATPSKEVENDH